MLETSRVLNETLEEDDRSYMCIGIEYGSLLRLADDAFGDPVNIAFKLGEDVAEPNEILIGNTAFDRARNTGFDFSKYRSQRAPERPRGKSRASNTTHSV